jgi:hypothetical protein
LLYFLRSKLAEMCNFSSLTMIAWPLARALDGLLVSPKAFDMRSDVPAACAAGIRNTMSWHDYPLLAASFGLKNIVEHWVQDEIKEPQVIVRADAPCTGLLTPKCSSPPLKPPKLHPPPPMTKHGHVIVAMPEPLSPASPWESSPCRQIAGRIDSV